MSTQSEAALEEKLINKLVESGYEKIQINNEKDLITNFKTQLEKFNKILLHLEGG